MSNNTIPMYRSFLFRLWEVDTVKNRGSWTACCLLRDMVQRSVSPLSPRAKNQSGHAGAAISCDWSVTSSKHIDPSPIIHSQRIDRPFSTLRTGTGQESWKLKAEQYVVSLENWSRIVENRSGAHFWHGSVLKDVLYFFGGLILACKQSRQSHTGHVSGTYGGSSSLSHWKLFGGLDSVSSRTYFAPSPSHPKGCPLFILSLCQAGITLSWWPVPLALCTIAYNVLRILKM